METKVLTGKRARLSYAKLIEPGDKSGKYESAILIPKSDKETVEKVKKAIEAAKELGKTKKWKGKIPSTLEGGLRDGDEYFEDKGEGSEAYKDHFFVSAKNKDLPFLCDKNRVQLDPSKVFSGCYGIASISFFAYNEPKNGIGCIFRGFQLIDDSEPLGGGGNAANDFAEIEEEDDFS